jgi:hypothetical protein
MLAPSASEAMTLLRGLAGAVVGGVIGSLAFEWALPYGIHLMALPGAMVGIGCGIATARRSLAAGILAGVAALDLSVYLEWKCFPFVRDNSLGFFLRHLHEASMQTRITVIVGTLLGFWFGWRRSGQMANASAAPKGP